MMLFVFSASLMALMLFFALHFHQKSSLKIKRISVENVGGKKIFVLRLNSNDFLFEEKEGEISFLSSIQDKKNQKIAADFSVEEKILQLLELDNAGNS